MAWDLYQIRDDLEAGRAALDGLNLDAAADTGLAELATEAAGRLDDAAARADSSPALRLLGQLPVLDDQVDGVRRMTAVTDRLGETGLTAARRLDADLGRAGEPAGRVALLATALEELDNIDEALAGVDLGRPDGLVGPLRGAHDDLVETIEEARTRVQEGRALIEPIRAMLQGPSTFLLLAANNAEMAGGAGLALSAGPLTFQGGEIDLGEVIPARQLRLPKSVALPGDLRSIYRPTGVGIDFRSTTRTPNLPVMGPVVQAMATELGIEDLDGVVIVDAVMLARLMEVTEGVTVRDTELTADNVLSEVLNESYKEFQSTEERPERDSYQGEIAKAVFESLTTGNVDAASLAAALLDGVEGRHLLLWSGAEDLQSTWAELGAHGGLEERDLLIAFQNYSANKMDWYLRPAAALDVRRLPSGDYRARLTMSMEMPPLSELPDASPYILGNSPELQGLFLTVHLPADASDITTPDPPGFRTQGIDPPLHARTFLVDVPAGTTLVRRVDFTLPREVSVLRLLPSARVEPLPLTIDGRVTVTDDVPQLISWFAAARPPADGEAPVAARVAVIGAAALLVLAAGATAIATRRPVGSAPRAATVGQLAALASLALTLVAAVLGLLLGDLPV